MAVDGLTEREEHWLWRFFFIGVGVCLLFWSLIFTYAAFFESPEPVWTGFESYLEVHFLLMCWSLTGACLLCVSDRCWFRRARDRLGLLAAGGFVSFLLLISLKDALGFDSYGMSPMRGDATIVAVLVLYVVLGLGLFLLGRRSVVRAARKDQPDIVDSPWVIVAWPIFCFGKAPFGTFICVSLLVAVIYGGEVLGERFGHPLLGASCVPVGIVILLLLAPVFVRKATGAATKDE